jgi:cell division protein FtsI (penicillin-binding protein 3)
MAVTSRPVQRPRPWSAPARGQRTRAETSRLRVLWLLAVALILASAIWGRLAYWQVVRHGELASLAAENHRFDSTLPAVRGMIYDRDGNPLAVNTTVYDVAVTPDQVPERRRSQVADALSSVLGLSRQSVMDVLISNRKYAYLAHRQPKGSADALDSMNLPGIVLEPQQARTYLPGGTQDVTLASSLLGFVNYGGHGQQGIEQWYQDELAGRNGHLVTYRDSDGNPIALGNQQRQLAVNGTDLTLTLDRNVQNAAEQALADGVKAAKADSGSVIVMDSKTGAIAAWANYPAYDANKFATDDPSHFRDPILSDVYEPGSVMKVVTLAGALDQGKITPSTTIQDPGYIVVGGHTLHDWNEQNNGTVTMTRVLENSLNVGAVRAMQYEGQDAFLHYLDAFGLEKPSGVDVAGEQTYKFRTQWRASELATASFGQGVAVNMVQMAAAVNVIANQGRLVTPHVVATVGGRAPVLPPQRQAISQPTAATMTQMMESVVQNGSGWTARVRGFEKDEAGKTGTSQIPENGGYSNDHVWASYVGFLPASNPSFTMLVVVRKPNNGSSDHNEGYYVSAPIWKRIAEQIIPQWRITPGAFFPSN